MQTCVCMRVLVRTIIQRILWHLIARLPQKQRFVCPLHHQDEYLLSQHKYNQSNHCSTFQHVSPPPVSFLLVKRNDHTALYRGSFLFYSPTRDLSRLTATYFSRGHFSDASPARRLNTRPTSQSTGAFLKNCFSPLASCPVALKIHSDILNFTFRAFSRCSFPQWLQPNSQEINCKGARHRCNHGMMRQGN